MTTERVSFISRSAWPALSAFCRVMLDISSSEDDVSSMPAACCEDPAASDWLAADTWAAAEDTCSAPSESPAMMRRSARLTEMLSSEPKASANPKPVKVPTRAIPLDCPAICPAALADSPAASSLSLTS